MRKEEESCYTISDFAKTGKELIHIMVEICEARYAAPAQNQPHVTAALAEHTQVITSSIKSFISIANIDTK